jgi:hypothetical protein
MTRSELKRGAFDLPEEAKESAAAMRRAVAEQIKALQDISHIVGRSTQQLEISEPARRPRRSPPASAQPRPSPTTAAAVVAPAPAPAATSIPHRGDRRFRPAWNAAPPASARQHSRPPAPAGRLLPRRRPPAAGSAICCVAHRVTSCGEAPARRPRRGPRTRRRLLPRAATDSRNPRHVVV